MPDGAGPAALPPERPAPATVTTLWLFTFLTLALLLYRLYWRRRVRAAPFARDDVWMGVAAVPLLLRLAFIHMSAVLLTANFNREKYPQSSMAPDEVARRTLGAQMILPGRVSYAAFLWCMKLCILHWFETVTGRTGHYGRAIDAAYYAVWLTFVGVVVSTFVECRPIAVYWQIFPDPGVCVKATVQLVTMGALNIATDVILLAIPLPLVFAARMPVIRKLQLLLLFCVSIFVIGITVIRMPIIIGSTSLQQARTLWASIECFAAALVANAPMFNAMLRRRHAPASAVATPPGAPPRRTAAMPVTGQDSAGSLTRNEGAGAVAKSARGGGAMSPQFSWGGWPEARGGAESPWSPVTPPTGGGGVGGMRFEV
ncbi:hypothetical protein EDC01DRAFT_465251 [Geopyxis carbonaria]|nr:hypothetical protein EDC01DRAFT_465251 [Geopyxis carbonaria]